MANVSYQGPLPLPTASWRSSLPWPTVRFTAKSPATVTGGAVSPVPVAATLQGGALATVYTETIDGQGGIGPYTFSITSGALPTGLSLASGGAISGTPTVAGTFVFTVRVTDSAANTGSHAFAITIGVLDSGGGNSGYVF